MLLMEPEGFMFQRGSRRDGVHVDFIVSGKGATVGRLIGKG